MSNISNNSGSIALLYHDVVPSTKVDDSGIVTENSWRYKVSPETFRSHVQIIDASDFTTETINTQGDRNLYLTFDDGGKSALTAASILEEYGLRGHFFIIVGRVGDENYLSWEEVQELDERGHIIGSHTLRHRDLSKLPENDRLEELERSRSIIQERIGDCQALSIPMGQYDAGVIDDAKKVGYTYIFTSDPVRIRGPEESKLGRWNVWHDTTEEEIQKILNQDKLYCSRRICRWFLLKKVKNIIGRQSFTKARNRIIK